MQYWYPDRSRVSALTAELYALVNLATDQALNAENHLSAISDTLEAALGTKGFPRRQIAQWMWVASQFRIGSLNSDYELAVIAGVALNFLGKVTAHEVSTSDVQDLNWVLETTIRRLSEIVPAETLRSCLTADELLKIESKLATFALADHFDLDEIKTAVQEQVQQLVVIAFDGNLGSLRHKLDSLFKASLNQTQEGVAARAALLYLADKHDIVQDAYGILGLFDDIYVIEWAYAVVESQTRCLHLVRNLLHQYPFVGDLALVGEPARSLDIYSQYAVTLCLDALFVGKSKFIEIVREIGPYALLSAFNGALQAAKLQTQKMSSDISAWPIGQNITISDGTTKFNAIFRGLDHLTKGNRYRISVRNQAIITVPLHTMRYMARFSGVHRQLSNGTEISEWVKHRHPDPMVFVTGSARRREQDQQCILLVGPRQKIDQYLPQIRPLGTSAAALVGFRYITNLGNPLELYGSTHETPYIYACSDVYTANELITAPPPHVGTWNIIVDGAKLGRSLYAILNTTGGRIAYPMCIFSELHEREDVRMLQSKGVESFFAQDKDVEVLPLYGEKPDPEANLIVRTLKRQSAHWLVTRTIYEVRNKFLEAISAWLKQLSPTNGQNHNLNGLDLMVVGFLQRCLANPLPSIETSEALTHVLKDLTLRANMLRQYEPAAADLLKIFDENKDDEGLKLCRPLDLVSIAAETQLDETVAIVCRSSSIAQRCAQLINVAVPATSILCVTIEQLRSLAPIDHLIVPGWLDRLSMRELASCGYATRISLVFLPFERVWYESTASAISRWEVSLEIPTRKHLSSIEERLSKASIPSKLWNEQTRVRLEQDLPTHIQDPGTDDKSELDFLETRAVEQIDELTKSYVSASSLVRAQLVMFEEFGSYAFLPPDGKVIVLSIENDLGTKDDLGKGEAERRLRRSVSTLQPGDVLAMPTETDRDLVDMRADKYLREPQKERHCASLWRAALRRYVESHQNSVRKFSDMMAQQGHPRDPSTIRYWLLSNNTVAPRNYRETIPLIARLTNDHELSSRSVEVLAAIDLIYRARSTAAEAIILELFAGEIDLNRDKLVFDVDSAQFHYALRHVKRLEGIRDVSHDLVGRPLEMLSKTQI